ncbi:MAG: hypothetical protein M5R36_00890 [Deltaproteobacteria bacterium]|nr:hypothetical protein [Deltaproteobacteria bacterium]
MSSRSYRFILLIALLAMAAMPLSCSCGDDDDDDDDDAGDDDDDDGDPGDVEGVECDTEVEGLCVLTGVITESFTMTTDFQWLLRGGVFIGNDTDETVLSIDPGVQIFGESSTNGMLVITRGSRLEAEGTADEPIVFSSSKLDGERARGDWGGLIINGRAPINNCTTDTEAFCEAIGEGGTGSFGGSDPDDNSGTLNYVRVEFAGRLISPDNELNGIAFQGVGRGTTVDYIQVHMNKDDGVEFFGGTVNAKHVVVTGVADDGIDWTDGWQGRLQFGVVQQYEDGGDQGIEADNNAEDNTATPRSHPIISNVTLIGSPDSEFSDLGMLLREGTAANLSNVVVKGFNEAGLMIDHNETFDNAWAAKDLNGELTLTNSIIDCDTTTEEPELDDAPPFTVADFFSDLNDGNDASDPMIADPYNQTSPDFTLDAGSPALSGAVVPSDSFFDEVDFIGAFGTENWASGWTTSAPN